MRKQAHRIAAAAIAALPLTAGADILVADFRTGQINYDDRILRFDEQTGEFLGEFVQAGAPLDGPIDMAFGPNGGLYVTSIYITGAGAQSSNVIEYDGKSGQLVRTVVRTGVGGLCAPAGIAFGPDGRMYVSSGCGGQVLRFDAATGAPLGTFIIHSTFPPGGVNLPTMLMFGPDDHVYVNEYHDASTRKFTLSGGQTAGFHNAGFGSSATAMGMALGKDKLYVALYGWDDIAVFDFPSGEFVNFISVLNPQLGLFEGGPHGLAMGPDGMLYCANHLDHAVAVIDPVSGTVVRTIDGGFMDRPTAIVFVPEAVCEPDCNADGALNLADFGCFQTRFALGDPYADCNDDGNLNLADFGCFQTKFALGCP